MRTLGPTELDHLLEPGALRSAMREALRAQAAGHAVSSPRHVLPLEGGCAGAMLGAFGRYAGGKLVHVGPGGHEGVVALFDAATGAALLLAHAGRLTALRTAAASAAATEALARPDSATLVVTGAGEQARAHVAALLPVRPFRRLRVAARDGRAAARLAEEFAGLLDVEATTDLAGAARGADVLCLCTAAKEPYLDALPDGVHVNAVGACRPGARELRLRGPESVFVDSLAAARAEAEELRGFEGKITEIGEVFAGAAGRRHAPEVTVFKSVGIAVEDVAALALAFERSPR